MSDPVARPARMLAIVHGAQAAALLARPATTTRAVVGDAAVPPTWIVRVLGVRVLAQAAAEAALPRAVTLRAGVAVDGLHAASMVLAAVVRPEYRRAALAAAAAAGASAFVGAGIARRGR